MKKHIELGKAYTLKDSIDYATGATVSKLLTKNKNGSITLFAFDQGQGLSEHTAPFDAIVTVVEGQCEITIAGQSNVLSAGQMIVMPAKVPHALEAIESFKMLLIMIKA
ncbi:MAG: cupin domain-containing protein [Saprospiraceae bacterium]